MNKPLSQFLDRLAERLTALAVGLVSARVQSLHAEVQADEQSRLEDLARQYEADGKPQIAAALRTRAVGLSSSDLAAEGVDILRLVGSDALSAAGAEPRDPLALPDFHATSTTPRPKRSKSKTAQSAPNDGGQP